MVTDPHTSGVTIRLRVATDLYTLEESLHPPNMVVTPEEAGSSIDQLYAQVNKTNKKKASKRLHARTNGYSSNQEGY